MYYKLHYFYRIVRVKNRMMVPHSIIQYTNYVDISLKLNVFISYNNATLDISDVPTTNSQTTKQKIIIMFDKK